MIIYLLGVIFTMCYCIYDYDELKQHASKDPNNRYSIDIRINIVGTIFLYSSFWIITVPLEILIYVYSLWKKRD